MSFEKIMTECSTKDVVLTYKRFIDDCLPEHLKKVAPGMDSPESIQIRITKLQSKLDYLNNTSREEQIENYITGYQKWREDVETRLTEEQKLLREKCNKTINDLRKWEPVSESSKYYKGRLIFLIKDLLAQSIYAREWFVHPETPDTKSAEREIMNRQKELTEWIENLKNEYPMALEIKKERELLENKLMHDLELLVSLNMTL
jgi:hypothetical protein